MRGHVRNLSITIHDIDRQRAKCGLAPITPPRPTRAKRFSGASAKNHRAADMRREPIHLTLPLPPSANRYWRKTNRGRVYLSAEAKQFKARVALLARNCTPFQGDVNMTLRLFCNRQGDIDNRAKVCVDALAGWCYGNDRQVRTLLIDWQPAGEGWGPCVRVMVQARAVQADYEAAAERLIEESTVTT